MHSIIKRYIDKLMTSDPSMPLWNIESIRQGKKPAWNYIDGCMTSSLIEMYKTTKEEKYIEFVKKFVDYYVFEDGSIRGYDPNHFSTDDVCESRILFDLYDLTHDEKYNKAIDKTYWQVLNQPRTKEGNFWHKKIYPHQIWLDGLYMMQPFSTRYQTIKGNKDYSDIVNQFKNVRTLMFDETKKLYYHGYDSSKSMFWANKETGLSKNFWLRSIGWFTVGLIDVYDYMDDENGRQIIKELFVELKSENAELAFISDEAKTKKKWLEENQSLLYFSTSKMFYQLPDKKEVEGNYLETSGSSMIAYALLKGSRLNVLDKSYQEKGIEIFNGICKKYLSVNEDGDLNLGGICLVAGLGPENNLRRDGTVKYYCYYCNHF